MSFLKVVIDILSVEKVTYYSSAALRSTSCAAFVHAMPSHRLERLLRRSVSLLGFAITTGPRYQNIGKDSGIQ